VVGCDIREAHQKTKTFYVGEGTCGIPESFFSGRKRYQAGLSRNIEEHRGCFLYAGTIGVKRRNT